MAANVLRRCDVELDVIQRAVAANIRPVAVCTAVIEVEADRPSVWWRRVTTAAHKWMTSERLPQSGDTNRIVERAIEEARALRHNYVGTEHLLLGLLREPDSAAAQLLIAQGVKCDDVRAEIIELLR